MIIRNVYLLLAFILLVPTYHNSLAQELDCDKEVMIFAPDPSEYKQLKDEEASIYQSMEVESSDLSMEAEDVPTKESAFQQSYSNVIFCSEANCNSLAVTLGGQTHSNYLTCSNNVSFYGVSPGIYSISVIGCGLAVFGSVDVDGYTDYVRFICPGNTDIGCCSQTCLIGEYYCSSCRLITTTTSSIRPTTTSSISGGARVTNHMMTKAINADSICDTPTPEDTFNYVDDAAYCWFTWSNASASDEIKIEWYEPNGDLYREQNTNATYTSGCWSPGISIKDSPAAYISGNWRVDVSFQGIDKFSEYFTIVGLPPTTTTTSIRISTTTSSYPPGPCMMTLIYGEQSDEAQTLRWYRDNVLSQTPEGREIIKLYYLWSPTIVKAMERDEEFKEDVKQMIDGVLPMIGDEVR